MIHILVFNFLLVRKESGTKITRMICKKDYRKDNRRRCTLKVPLHFAFQVSVQVMTQQGGVR